jgi:hypothetical protein
VNAPGGAGLPTPRASAVTAALRAARITTARKLVKVNKDGTEIRLSRVAVLDDEALCRLRAALSLGGLAVTDDRRDGGVRVLTVGRAGPT